MRKQIINENWETEEVIDLDELAAVLFKYGSNQGGYAEAFDFDDLVARQAYDHLVQQYQDANADALTHIYLVKLPNTPQVISLLDTALYNGNERDPEAIEAVNNLCNRADCETLDSWGGCLSEGKKKKKVCSSITYTTGYPDLNIKHFNKCMGTDGLGIPDPYPQVVGDTLPNAPVADAGNSNSDGASDAGNNNGGESGLGENLTEDRAPVEIADMKSLIQDIVEGYKITTEKSSKLSLLAMHANGEKKEDVISWIDGNPEKHVTEHYNFTVSGGLNGSGEWSDYFDDLSDLAQSLKKQTGWEPVAVDVSTDTLDDLFYVEFNLFNPGKEEAKESLQEDLIVIEPFEAKEKLNKLVNQIKEQEDDEVKKSLLDLLNVYLFQTVGPENREDCDLTEDEWKETSEFAQEETDKYYEEHPEELPGTEEHAAKKDNADGEEVDESLKEDYDSLIDAKNKLEDYLTNDLGLAVEDDSELERQFINITVFAEKNEVPADIDELVLDWLNKNNIKLNWNVGFFDDGSVEITISEEVDESLTEAKLDYPTQYAKMKALENRTRGFNAASASDEKLEYNWKLCKKEGFKYAQSVMEQEMLRRGGYLADLVKKSLNQKIVINTSYTLKPEDFDPDILSVIYDLVVNDPDRFWQHVVWADALRAILVALITRNKTLSDQIKDKILGRFSLSVDELKEIINRHIQNQEIFKKLKSISANTESLQEEKAYSHKLAKEFELPPDIKILNQKQVEDFIHQLDPEELFTIGYATPLYFYSGLDNKFDLVKATEMEGYTGVDYRYANVEGELTPEEKAQRLEITKQQIANNQNGVDKQHGFKLNPGGDKFSAAYRDTNKLALNQSKANVAQINGEKVDMSKILFYPKIGSKPKVSYYVWFKNTPGVIWRKIPRNVLVDTLYKAIVEKQYGAVATLSDADKKWLAKSGYGKDERVAIWNFKKAHGDIPVTIFRAAQAEGVDPQKFWEKHPMSPRWSIDEFVEKVEKHIKQDTATVIAVDAETASDKELSSGAGMSPEVDEHGDLNQEEAKPQVRALYSNQVYFLRGRPGVLGTQLAEGLKEDMKSSCYDSYVDWAKNFADDEEKQAYIDDVKNNQVLSDNERAELLKLAENINEEVELDEAKRYVKRYYVRPQNIFCSNKEDILKALLRVEGENCSIYSLKNLSDHDDVQNLQPSDIIYYYDDGILYDKNHVKVMDYDLNVKHEEDRKKFANVDAAPDSQVDQEYDDRLTDADLKDKEAVANFRAINARQMK